jgi:DNA ligase-1
VNEIPDNITDYLASEKMDGVRGIWTGSEFITRHGNILNVPAWFKAGMPAVRLDGELWMGHGTFDKLQSEMQRKGGDWRGITYQVFDMAVLRKTTAERIAALRELRLPCHCCVISHAPLDNHAELDDMETDIVARGGEGICLRHKDEFYRPNNFIKIKRLFPDLDRWQG